MGESPRTPNPRVWDLLFPVHMISTESARGPSLEQADTNNRTIIWWHESANGYDPDDDWDHDHFPMRKGDWYQSADLTNNGYKNGEWWNKPFYQWLENDRLIETCSGQLPLTLRERAHAKGLFHRLKGEKFGIHKEVYGVTSCLYAVEANDDEKRRAHPAVPNRDKPEQFNLKNVSEKFNVPVKWLRSAYGRIEYWVRHDELNPSPTFDTNRERAPLEYEHHLTELWLEETE